MQLRCSLPELDNMFISFQNELIAQGVEQKDTNDIKNHFMKMMRLNNDITQKRNANQRKPNNIDRDTEFAQHIASQLSGNI